VGDRFQEPVEVGVASDLASFQRVTARRPEYVLPLPVDRLEPPPGQDQYYEARDQWASRLGGVPADFMEVQVTVTGKSNEPAILTNLRINVLERRPPMPGTHVTYGPIGEAVPERFVAIDLDDNPPTIGESTDERHLEEGVAVDPIQFPYRVDQGESEVFYLFVTTDTCDCDWVAELFVTVGSDQRRVTIDDAGKPFRLTSSAAAQSFASNDGATFQPENITSEVAPPQERTRPSGSPVPSGGVCVEDSRDDAAPVPRLQADIRTLCVTYSSVIRVEVTPAAPTDPATDPGWVAGSNLQVRFDTGGDGVEDFYGELRRGPSGLEVALIDLAGAQQQVCSGRALWDGIRLSLEFDAACLRTPESVDVGTALIYAMGHEVWYDEAPNLTIRRGE
jgi:hypothetical protein